MTQEDLAQALGAKKSMINYYENRAQNPTLETVQKVASFFGLSPDELMSPPDENQKKSGAPSRLQRLTKEIEKLTPYKQNIIFNMLEGALGNK